MFQLFVIAIGLTMVPAYSKLSKGVTSEATG